MTHYARRKDANHNAITAMALACGFAVYDTSGMGNNFPDLVVAFERTPGNWHCELWEIKSARGKLRDGQKQFFARWPGPKAVIRTDADVQARRDALMGGR